MSFMDDLMKQSGGLGEIASLAAKNPELVRAALALLSSKDTSVGGSSGLAELVGSLEKSGLGDIVSSWIANGPNKPVSPTQVTSALGPDILSQFASRAGVDHGKAPSVLAELLPALVNQLTPEGRLPETGSLESTLGGFLAQLGS